MPGEAISSDTVAGTLTVCSMPAYVLMDSGSTHSYVSSMFARNLNVMPELLGYDLSVHSPIGKPIVSSHVYKLCEVVVSDKVLAANLIPLTMQHFDVILGMDWLTAHYAVIDCVSKRVSFREPGSEEFHFQGRVVVSPPFIISAMRACRLVKNGCQAFLCSVTLAESESPLLEDIPVVCEFFDVFLRKLPDVLVDREIEFGIDVMPGT